MRKFFVFAVISLLLAAPLAAQSKAPHAIKDKFEVFAGYSLTRSYGDYSGLGWDGSSNQSAYKSFNMNGGELAVSYFLTPNFGLTVDFDATTKDGTEGGYPTWHASNTMQHYLVGPTYRHDLIGNFSAYGHALVGAAHLTADEYQPGFSSSGCTVNYTTCKAFGPAVFLGGGLDYKISRRIKIRPAQLDYWMHSYQYNSFSGIKNSPTSDGFKQSATGLRYSVGGVFSF